jgi:hypothetical protein
LQELFAAVRVIFQRTRDSRENESYCPLLFARAEIESR